LQKKEKRKQEEIED